MGSIFGRVGGLALALSLCSAPLRGQVVESRAPRVEPQMRLGFTYVGIDTDAGPSAAGELSYLGSTPRFWRAGVIGGVFVSTDGAVYGYAGLHLPIPLPLGVLARPSFSVGLYERGGGMELGHALEFRSSIVFERVIADPGVRVSAMLYHLSNAGLGFTNPGLEAVGVAVAVPIWNREE